MSSIVLTTRVPGPVSQQLARQAAHSVARPVFPASEVFIRSGRGAVVEDVDGNHLLDFTGGLGCLVVGHSHPSVVAAVKEQAELFLHTDYNVVAYELYQLLAERIARACGGERKVALFNSGAEAVENAVKVARSVTGRPGILCFEGAFHGRTHFALSLTYRQQPFKEGFGPFSEHAHRVPYPGLDGATLQDFEQATDEAFRVHSIGAALVEPILGEGGVVVPPPDFLPRLQRMCHRHGALLIADEIQTGYGRSGRFLVSEHWEVRPEVVLLGKSIAAGLPLSAVVGESWIMDQPASHALGGTYVGNPLACAAGLAVLDVIEQEQLMPKAAGIGEALMQAWTTLAGQGGITEVRGIGAMVGVQFEDPARLQRLIEAAADRGVILTSTGVRSDVLRHLPPLVTTSDQVAEAVAVMQSAFDPAPARMPSAAPAERG
ncbi:MAG: aspartate aminotransferase family protein [Actinomycetota bacterium]